MLQAAEEEGEESVKATCLSKGRALDVFNAMGLW